MPYLATLAEKMGSNLNQRFACPLDSTGEKSSPPAAAAACFVNPTVCEILVNVYVVDGYIQELPKQAEDYVVKCSFPHAQQQDQTEDDAEEEVIKEPEAAPSSKQPVFRFLSKFRTTRPTEKMSTTSIRQQIIKYKEEFSHPITEDTGTYFWLEESDRFLSQFKTFCMRLIGYASISSFCREAGDLTRGGRHRGRVTLE